MSCQVASRVASRVARLAQAESIGFCLPFLYCTRTILSPVRAHAINSKPRGKGGSSQRPYSTIQPKRSPQTTDRFEEDNFLRENPESSGIESQEEAPKPRRSTLTLTEKAAFDAIWTEIDEREQESIHHEEAEADHPWESLNEIFEHAILQLEDRERGEAERAAKDRSYFQEKNARPVLEALRNIPDIRSIEPSPPDEGNRDVSGTRVLAACNEHRDLVTKMLKSAPSDLEIWNVLESEVFSLVEQLQQQLADQAKADKKLTKARKKRETSKGDSEAAVIRKEPQKLETVASQKAFLPLFNETRALPTNAMLTNLQANYAYYNILALRLWRQRHPTSTYALQLLPRIKSLGPISYVLGASTSLYNEILFVKWTHFNDLHGIADLLNEMGNQGVEPNALTLSSLRFISRTRNTDLTGQRGKVLQSWWNMRAVKDGWERVKSVALQVQANVLKRERDEVEEQSEGETEDEQAWRTDMQNALDKEEDESRGTHEKTSPFRVSRVSWTADKPWVRKKQIRKVGSDSDRSFFEVRRNRSDGWAKSTM